jgi:hypothetical protein
MDRLGALLRAAPRPLLDHLAAMPVEYEGAVVNHSPSAQPLTWEAITSEHPLLADALHVAKRLSRRSPGFCANRVWHSVLEPLVVESAGWVPERSCPLSEQWMTLADLIVDKPIQHSEGCRQVWARQTWPRSSEAYELAYDRQRVVDDASPDCRHDGWCA